jgi:hypothetical protein
MATSVTPASTYSKKAKPCIMKSEHEEITLNNQTNLGSTCSVFTDEIERFKLPEALEELHNIFFIKICWKTTNEDFVDGIGDVSGNNSRYMDPWRRHFNSSVVLRTTDFKRSVDENNPIKGHGGCCIFCAAELSTN